MTRPPNSIRLADGGFALLAPAPQTIKPPPAPPAPAWPPPTGATLAERAEAAEKHARRHLDGFICGQLGPLFQVVGELAAEVERLRAYVEASSGVEEAGDVMAGEVSRPRRFLSRWDRQE